MSDSGGGLVDPGSSLLDGIDAETLAVARDAAAAAGLSVADWLSQAILENSGSFSGEGLPDDVPPEVFERAVRLTAERLAAEAEAQLAREQAAAAATASDAGERVFHSHDAGAPAAGVTVNRDLPVTPEGGLVVRSDPFLSDNGEAPLEPATEDTAAPVDDDFPALAGQPEDETEGETEDGAGDEAGDAWPPEPPATGEAFGRPATEDTATPVDDDFPALPTALPGTQESDTGALPPAPDQAGSAGAFLSPAAPLPGAGPGHAPPPGEEADSDFHDLAADGPDEPSAGPLAGDDIPPAAIDDDGGDMAGPVLATTAALGSAVLAAAFAGDTAEREAGAAGGADDFTGSGEVDGPEVGGFPDGESIPLFSDERDAAGFEAEGFVVDAPDAPDTAPDYGIVPETAPLRETTAPDIAAGVAPAGEIPAGEIPAGETLAGVGGRPAGEQDESGLDDAAFWASGTESDAETESIAEYAAQLTGQRPDLPETGPDPAGETLAGFGWQPAGETPAGEQDETGPEDIALLNAGAESDAETESVAKHAARLTGLRLGSPEAIRDDALDLTGMMADVARPVGTPDDRLPEVAGESLAPDPGEQPGEAEDPGAGEAAAVGIGDTDGEDDEEGDDETIDRDWSMVKPMPEPEPWAIPAPAVDSGAAEDPPAAAPYTAAPEPGSGGPEATVDIGGVLWDGHEPGPEAADEPPPDDLGDRDTGAPAGDEPLPDDAAPRDDAASAEDAAPVEDAPALEDELPEDEPPEDGPPTDTDTLLAAAPPAAPEPVLDLMEVIEREDPAAPARQEPRPGLPAIQGGSVARALDSDDLAALRSIVGGDAGDEADAPRWRGLRIVLLVLLLLLACAAAAVTLWPERTREIVERFSILVPGLTGTTDTTPGAATSPAGPAPAEDEAERLPLDGGTGGEVAPAEPITGAPGDDSAAVGEVAPLSEADRLREAASTGDSEAQRDLADLYMRGVGVERDPVEAARWYRAAATGGMPGARFMLGQLHEAGLGVDYDPAAAAIWYRLAADQNHPGAQLALARSLRDGFGLPRDATAARDRFRQAARQNVALAARDLAMMYRDGDGIPSDLIQAFRWFSLGSVLGDPESTAAMSTLAGRMTADEITAARALLETDRERASDLPAIVRGDRLERITPDAGPAPATDRAGDSGTEANPDAVPVAGEAALTGGADARVAMIQELLARLNLPVGNIDGRLDPETREAIRNYQRTAGLEVDGLPSARLLANLQTVFRGLDSGN